MTYALFEENGDLKAGTVLADNGTSLQVELTTGRRAKVKAAAVYLRFAQPSAAELLPAAQSLADDIDLDFLWECSPQDEFAYAEFAEDYYGHAPSAAEAAGVLIRLQSAPVYFQRKGRGRFRPANAETLKLALAAIEKRRVQELEIEQMAEQMIAGMLPEAIRHVAVQLLVKPDKMSIEYRAFDRALNASRQAPASLLMRLGAFASVHAMHRACFEFDYFPAGTGFTSAQQAPDASWQQRIDALPQAAGEVFSIDDSSTTEIDDAFSVRWIDEARVRVGVHIAVPALGVDAGSVIDQLARDRLSTVYTPGEKITMLPDQFIEAFSLDAGRQVPALSLYLDVDLNSGTILERQSCVERIRIHDNLRHDQLDSLVTEQALAADSQVALPHGDALRVLWRLTNALSAERERVRGKPEPRFRTDFSFYVDGDSVRIVQRRRDAPLDRIVAEMMILANSEWGRLLAELGVTGLYRSQQGGRVRMSTDPAPHEGLGVAQYIWSTSPLRRYIDLVNQRQLVAALRGERIPYAANDSELFSLLSAFEARYSAYNEYQQRMERYWCLRWLEQLDVRQIDAVTVRDDLVRLVAAPLYFRPTGLPALPPGRRILVDLIEHELIDLSIGARFRELAGPSADEASPGDAATSASTGSSAPA